MPSSVTIRPSRTAMPSTQSLPPVRMMSGGDYTAVQRGTSAEDAQTRLYNGVKAKGHPACWPVWQGKISG